MPSAKVQGVVSNQRLQVHRLQFYLHKNTQQVTSLFLVFFDSKMPVKGTPSVGASELFIQLYLSLPIEHEYSFSRGMILGAFDATVFNRHSV